MTITAEDTLSALESVVKEAGEDYVYTEHYDECVYIDRETMAPCCIAGRALVKLGYEPKEIIAADLYRERDDGSFTNASDEATKLPHYIDIPQSAANILRAAQETQDMGDPWGDALSEAKAYVNGE